MQKYYVSRDVLLAIQSRKREDWPAFWNNVNAYQDEIEIEFSQPITQKNENKSLQILKQWFGHRINIEDKNFKMDSLPSKPKVLKITFSYEEGFENQKTARPLFRSFFYSNKIEYPKPFKESPLIIAFHSYKGGVGRTLSALSLCRSFSRKKNNARPLRLLIIDADFEAPGLTWLAREKNYDLSAKFNDFSFLDALNLIHENEQWDDEILSFIANKVREELLQLSVDGVVTEHYFLPAYRDEKQLLTMPIAPADIVQFKGREWIIGDFVHQLGKKLDVDVVIIDLRAGISEFAAPILFDPRIQQILVTTTSLQSVYGTELILRQLIENTPKEKNNYCTPYVFISMVTDEAESAANRIQEKFISLSSDDSDELITSSDIFVKVLPFSEELVHLEGFDNIDIKLSGTPFEKQIDEVANELFHMVFQAEDRLSFKHKEGFLRELESLCKKMEYAEMNETTQILKTLPIRNLAQKFSSELPATVVMGAKGSGKTFVYLQVIKKGCWTKFVQEIVEINNVLNEAVVIPLLSSRNLSPSNKELVRECLEKNLSSINDRKDFESFNIHEIIEQKVLNGDVSEFSWQRLWISIMAKYLGLSQDKDFTVDDIHNHLKQINKKVVFVIDGLEDIFLKITENESQQTAVRALCQGILTQIQEIPQSNLGIVVFIRKDIVKQSIHQNLGQFYRLYDSYELRWNQVEALRLILWICKTVDEEWIIPSEVKEIEYLGREMVEKSLIPLWGLKLGKDDSKEAYTANWVVSALSDFRGQLQARDAVRFLRQASTLMIGQSIQGKNDRYLQPGVVRQAIDYCSSEKVDEIAQEIPILEPIFNKIRNAPENQREIPFEKESLGLTTEEIKILDSLGIVFKQEEGYYMPEIFRRGLNLKLRKGARPKVISLLKNALKKS